MSRRVERPQRPQRRADALSRERILQTAIAILDTAGENALTFRTLAARLATGPGAIYWHIPSKGELLAEAADTAICASLATARATGTPAQRLRALALALFDTIEARPWLGTQLSTEPWQLASLRIYEAVGTAVIELGVPSKAQFNVSSAVSSYITGVAAENAANARNAPVGIEREVVLGMIADRLSLLDAGEFPFLLKVRAEMGDHDDREQFVAGIDLLLAGIAAL